ncbi:MAG TPA: DUF2281 domain-containing protein [Longimicrobiales bacterium]|nr:DUF2281 domain-containing protein [Longimicrobiales bacterium]
MEDVTRKRILRQLDTLPDEQLYQVLDYIEFLAAKYAAAAARKPDAFQRFAERVEDQMRVRSLAPRAVQGTMKIMSTAGKMFEGVRDLGRDLVSTPPEGQPAAASTGPAGKAAVAARPDPTTPAPPPPPTVPRSVAPFGSAGPERPGGGAESAGDSENGRLQGEES